MQNPEVAIAGATMAGLSFSDENAIDDMYLTFALAEEEYGVAISAVTEIVGMQHIMEVPDVPAYIRGVINLRGKVVPLMDARLRFGLPDQPYDERTVIIVLDRGDAPVGMIVDAVSEVREILPERIDAPINLGRSGRSFVRGLARLDDRVAILLDIEQLLSAEVAEPGLTTVEQAN
ncbi:chemotaxis protein CheW [Plastorhodobacter daqingensis]|uniref:Chemotaxis protein CheW n=1 Tax=Plastorhodobacter daqingensis TaxID=1387281 RepID=A0ABW2UHZ0_9RHOB